MTHFSATLCVILFGGFASWAPGGSVLERSEHDPGPQQPETKPQASVHAGREDPRLTALAVEVTAQIEQLRGLAWKEPVRARWADLATLSHHSRKIEEALDSKERFLHEPTLVKLMGWIPLDMDLRAEQEKVIAKMALGFYSPPAQTFFVMEGTHPDAVRLIMAHELTHALEDQHFQFMKVDKRLKASTDRLLAHHAVLEGSAQAVMTLWQAEHLNALDTQALRKFMEAQDPSMLSELPRYLWQPLYGLYSAGQAFHARRAAPAPLASADLKDVQAAFLSLPRSTEQVLHPAKYWSSEQADEPVELEHTVGPLPEPWKAVFSDVLGEMLLALSTQSMTREVTMYSIMTLAFTTPGASGWGGDRATLLIGGEGKVLVLDSVWDTQKDAQEFAKACAENERGDPRLNRRIELLEGNRLRWIAWTGTDAEVATQVAAQVRFSIKSQPPKPIESK